MSPPMIDSLEMTDDHRRLILTRCLETPENRIVITHGTDSMDQTAAVLGKGITGKTIVLTGAMVPYTFGSSDGLFHLGTALAFAQTLPPGVYVAMNGRGAQESPARNLRRSLSGLLSSRINLYISIGCISFLALSQGVC